MKKHVCRPVTKAISLIVVAIVAYQCLKETASDESKVSPLQLGSLSDEEISWAEEKIQRRRLKSSPPLTTGNDPDRSYRTKDRASPIEERIVGGVPSEPEAYPFYGHSTGSFLCGGTFVHEDILLTAAHCLDTFVEDVIVGSNDLFGRDGAERIPVDELFPHPDYNNITEVNDIMLVKLESPSSASLVNWNLNEDLPTDGEDVKVIGFGQTSDGGMVSLELLEVQVDVIDFDTCSNLLAGVELADERVICAADLAGGKDSCQGDSGGPLLGLDNQIQYGLVSFGIGCGEPNRPAVYTRVSNYEKWIRQGICDLSANPPEYCIAAATGVPTLSPVAETATPTTAEPTAAATTVQTMPPATATPTTDAPTTAVSGSGPPTTAVSGSAPPTIAVPGSAPPTAAAPTMMAPTTAAPTMMAPTTATPTTASTAAPTMATPTTLATAPPTTVAPVTETDAPSLQISLPPTPQLGTTLAPTIVTATTAPSPPLDDDEPSAAPVLLTLSPTQPSSVVTNSPVGAPTRQPSTTTQAPAPVITPEPTVLATQSPTRAVPVVPPFGLIPPPVLPPVGVKPPVPSKPTLPGYLPPGKGKGKSKSGMDYSSHSYSRSTKSSKSRSKSSKSKKKSGKGPYYSYYRYYHAGSKGKYHQ